MRRPPNNLLELFEISVVAPAVPEPATPRLAVAAVPRLRIGPSEPARLDPRRSSAADNGRRPVPAQQQASRLGPFGSFALHLLPFLLLLDWHIATAEPERPIPVQLVIEQPPPPPPKPVVKAEEPKRAPPSRRASAEIGEIDPKPGQPASAAESTTEQPETQMAALSPPRPPPVLESALPKPAPMPEATAIPEPSKPPPLPPPAKQPVATRLPPRPHASPRKAEHPGPAATRDEYLAYCESLIHRYYDLLPTSVLAGRRGSVTLSILVLGDGTISNIRVVESSNYQDIDSRVEHMVASVRRFPPLPQWVQGPNVVLLYHHSFPHER